MPQLAINSILLELILLLLKPQTKALMPEKQIPKKFYCNEILGYNTRLIKSKVKKILSQKLISMIN